MSTQQGDVQLKPDSASTPQSIEGKLIDLASRGDEQAFGELYDIWAAKVYRFIYTKIKNAHVAEDLTSEVFLKAWEKLHQYKPQKDAKFSTWLYTVARNTIVDHYRANKSSEISFEDLPETADLEGEEPYKEAGELEQALSKLPPEYEKVLRLRFVEDYPIAKIAQLMRKKEDNIRAITSRALKKLREVLESSK
jgi:RNA polymerase sigma-70 factor (ECF subfamily)